jgi:hypothetical protein
MRMAGHVSCMGEEKKLYTVSVRKTKGKGPLRRPSCGWEDRIKVDFGKVGWSGGVKWIQLAQDRDRWWAIVMNLWVLAPQNSLGIAGYLRFRRI